MTSYTFDTLKSALVAWNADLFTDTEDQLPDFVAKAEDRCIRDLNLEIFDQVDTGVTTVAATSTISLPTDAIMLRSLFLDGNPVLERTEVYVENFAQQAASDRPLYWCQIGESEISLAPIPDAAYSARMRFLKRPTPLSDANPTTWLSTYAGDLLFAAAMLQAEFYNKSPADEQATEALYQGLLGPTRLELAMLARKGIRP